MRITAGQQMLLRPSQVNEPASSAKQITQLLDSTSVNKAWCRCVLGVDHGLIMSSFMMAAASCGGPAGPGTDNALLSNFVIQQLTKVGENPDIFRATL